MTDRPRTACPKCGDLKTAQGMPGHLRSHKNGPGRPRGSKANNGAPNIYQTKLLTKYLKQLNSGEKAVSPAKIRGQIEILNEKITAAQESGNVLRALRHTETRNRLEDIVESADLEQAFIKYAKGYSDHFGISYRSWQELNVPPRVLKAAGITK